jgi:hypothetical protein
MRSSKHRVLMLFAVGTILLPVSAQTVSKPSQAVSKPNVPTGKSSARLHSLPYTATYLVTNVSILKTGAELTSSHTFIQALDSQGRSIQASTQPYGPKNSTMTRYTVSDPVARAGFDWTVSSPPELIPKESRIVVSTSWPAPGAKAPICLPAIPAASPAPAVTDPSPATLTIHQQFDALRAWIRARPPVNPQPRDKSVTLDLGTKTIKGINVHGYRTTKTTMPADAEHGTAKPSVRVMEHWHTSDPGMFFLSVLDSSENLGGKFTQELVSLKLGEPDPALLQPPSDYTVVIKDPPPQPVCVSQLTAIAAAP